MFKSKKRFRLTVFFRDFFYRENKLVSDTLIAIWVISVLVSLAVVLYDVFTQNQKLTPVITIFWILIVLLSIFGVILYYFLGRKRISQTG